MKKVLKTLTIAKTMRYAKASGTNTEQRMMMDFAKLVLKIISLKSQELKLINTENKFMIAKLMVVRRI